MLKVPIYIYETGSTIYSDLDMGITQGYAPMYQKDLKVFKGVQNTLKFTVKNQDQKPIDISSGNTFIFTLLDSIEGKALLSKTATITDDGSTRSTKGTLDVTLNESDIINLNNQTFYYSLKRTVNNKNKPTFVNTYHDAAGRIEVVSYAYEVHTASYEITTFSTSTDQDGVETNVSSHIDAHPDQKRANNTHTVTYTTTGYDGTLTLQATLDVQPGGDTSWVDVKSVTLSNSTETNYFNVKGVYNWFRIKHIPTNSNTGTLDKVLIRS